MNRVFNHDQNVMFLFKLSTGRVPVYPLHPESQLRSWSNKKKLSVQLHSPWDRLFLLPFPPVRCTVNGGSKCAFKPAVAWREEDLSVAAAVLLTLKFRLNRFRKCGIHAYIWNHANGFQTRFGFRFLFSGCWLESAWCKLFGVRLSSWM